MNQLNEMLCVLEDDKDVGAVLAALKQDKVALLRGLDEAAADGLIHAIANTLGLADSLELQAAFASSLGHRHNIGRYYMSVNKREDYQIVTPHSEGNSAINMQLASFYCHENSTDGGETIVMQVNQAFEQWQQLREQVKRGKADVPLNAAQMNQIKAAFRLDMNKDELRGDDQVINQQQVVPGFKVFDVLARPQQSHSLLLDKPMYGYWDSVDSVDIDSVAQFQQFLAENGWLRQPTGDLPNGYDADASTRRRNSGCVYQDLFNGYLCHKMTAGDFIVQNNLSWTHAVANWTPGSGVRKVAAAFA